MNFGKRQLEKQIAGRTHERHRLLNRGIMMLFRFLLLLFLFVVICACSIGAGALSSILDDAPELDSVNVAPSGYATTLYDKDGNAVRTLVQEGSNRTAISYAEMPEDLVNAFIAIEDERFYSHDGIDIKGIFRAAFVGFSSGNFSEGASTITQQLIKNNVLSGGSENNWGDRISRKIIEQYLALELEQTMSKNEIIENYLNTINLGSNTLGVEAASNRYFNKSASDLSLSECAVIAAITQNPSSYNPVTHPEQNAERRETVLSRMLEQGLIPEDAYEEAMADDVYERIANVNDSYVSASPYTYFEDAVIESVIEDLQVELGYTQTQAYNYLYSGGLKIYTTLDSDIQAVVDEEVNNPDNYPVTEYSFTYSLRITDKEGNVSTVNESAIRSFLLEKGGDSDSTLIFSSEEEIRDLIESYKDATLEEGDVISEEYLDITLQPQVSMVILDNETGEVRAISGGRGDKTASLSLDRAIDSTRQPGSCFKVLADFAPAIDTESATLATTYYDAPYAQDEKDFSNWWGDDYVGYASIRQGIVYSMNIVALKCMVETVTPTVGYQYLKNFGFTTLVEGRQTENGYVTDIVPSLCLGGITDGVTNLEMTAAFATIANKGVYNEPTFYTRIEDAGGKVILEKTPESHTVLKETTSLLLTYAMEESFAEETSPWTEAGIAEPLGTGFDAGGMSVAAKSGSSTNENDVWFEGYSPYYTCGIWSGYDDSLSFGAGQTFHKEIWSNVMTRIHEDLEDPGFGTSDNIVTARICSTSGKLAINGVCGCGDDPGEVYYEYFVAGTEPTEYCSRHVTLNICRESGLLATDECPEESVEPRIYVVIDQSDWEENPDAETLLNAYTIPDELYETFCEIHVSSEEEEESCDEEEEDEPSERENETERTEEPEEEERIDDEEEQTPSGNAEPEQEDSLTEKEENEEEAEAP